MSIDENPPLSKRSGLAVTLAILTLAWYAIHSGWLNFEMSSIDIERRNAKASRMVEIEGVPSATMQQPELAVDFSTSQRNQ